MKKKHLFSAVALAAVFAGCSQDELISESNFQEADDRPTVEAPVITLGADTKMTTSNSYAGVTWEAGDGFGAMLMDTYAPTNEGKENTEWSDLFPIQDYVSSNVLYKTEDGKNFTAEASLKQGNYLFYAPFNEENFKREPLAVKLPLVQNVVPSATKEPSNTAIKEFYEAKTYPVFVAYDSIWNTPKTNLSLNMKHIYALPKITLKLGKVRLLDENGNLKVDSKTNPIYETSVAIDSIRFVSGAIATSGTIDNTKLIKKIGKDSKGKVAWDEAKYESAATADIVTSGEEGNKTVVVKFSPALTISATKTGEFFMVLPGAEYEATDLAVEVYTTINNKAYVSAANSTATQVKTILPFRKMRLLPGLPYSADEYNADGTMKDTKGTSATYTVEGGFIPAETAISGYTEIKSYAELTDFINKVAYRGEPLIEMTKKEAEDIIAASGEIPDPKKYFVITVDEKSPIELDDAFVAAFKNACVIADGSASIAFKTDNKQVTLGDINYSTDDPIKFNIASVAYDETGSDPCIKTETYDASKEDQRWALVTGNVVLSGTNKPAFGMLKVKKSASVELSDDLETGEKLVRVENNGGKVVSNTVGSWVKIVNKTGEATVNKTPLRNVAFVNGERTDPDEKDDVRYYATMNVNANMTESITNNSFGKINVRSSSATLVNNGLIVAEDEVAKITVTGGEGLIDNTNNGKVTEGTDVKQTVFAVINGSDGADGFAKYDELSGLNKIVLTGAWNISNENANQMVAKLFAEKDGGNGIPQGCLAKVKEIDFNAGSSLYVGSNVILDLSAIEKININADVTWSGRSESVSKVILGGEESNIINCAVKDDKGNKYTHTKVDVTVSKE